MALWTVSAWPSPAPSTAGAPCWLWAATTAASSSGTSSHAASPKSSAHTSTQSALYGETSCSVCGHHFLLNVVFYAPICSDTIFYLPRLLHLRLHSFHTGFPGCFQFLLIGLLCGDEKLSYHSSHYNIIQDNKAHRNNLIA